MEIMVYLFRALANRQRLCLLRVLAVIGEQRVSQLARAGAMRMVAASTHLRILATAGLVWRRRSGGAVYYRMAEAPASPVTQEAIALLRFSFGRVKARNPRQVAHAEQAGSPRHSDASLFALFTAFTHPRRLQIIRHLFRHGPERREEVQSTLSMSFQASQRHLEKLCSRGLVRSEGAGPDAPYALVPCEYPERAALLQTILGQLGAGRE